MSSINKCEFGYPGADFVASAGIVNIVALKQELVAALTSVTIDNVTNRSPNGAIVHATGIISATDKTSMDAVVAAHTGISFADTPLRSTAPALATDDSGSFVERVTLTTGPLRAGNYIVTFYMELATTTTTGNTIAAGQLTYSKNGGATSVMAESSNERSDFVSMGGTMVSTPVDGDSFTFKLAYCRVGTAGNPARVQRARLLYIKVD